MVMVYVSFFAHIVIVSNLHECLSVSLKSHYTKSLSSPTFVVWLENWFYSRWVHNIKVLNNFLCFFVCLCGVSFLEEILDKHFRFNKAFIVYLKGKQFLPCFTCFYMFSSSEYLALFISGKNSSAFVFLNVCLLA